MKDDWYVKDLAKFEACAVFHSRAFRQRFFTEIYRPLYGVAMFVSLRGNICHWVLLLKRKVITLELRHIEIDASFASGSVNIRNINLDQEP